MVIEVGEEVDLIHMTNMVVVKEDFQRILFVTDVAIKDIILEIVQQMMIENLTSPDSQVRHKTKNGGHFGLVLRNFKEKCQKL